MPKESLLETEEVVEDGGDGRIMTAEEDYSDESLFANVFMNQN